MANWPDICVTFEILSASLPPDACENDFRQLILHAANLSRACADGWYS